MCMNKTYEIPAETNYYDCVATAPCWWSYAADVECHSGALEWKLPNIHSLIIYSLRKISILRKCMLNSSNHVIFVKWHLN